MSTRFASQDLRSRIEQGRPALRRWVRKAERPILAAFLSIVERQARVGAVQPAVERVLATALRQVQMTQEQRGGRSTPRLRSPVVQAVVDQFHNLYYEDRGTWRQNTWQGVTTFKCPLDLWLYAEIVHRLRPGLIVETGTAYGGSASYLGMLLDLAAHGSVVSVDINPKPVRPIHPRVTYVPGSSTDPAIVDVVRARLPTDGSPVMVILDSDHSERHVYQELLLYADMVTRGSYLIIEDTNVNGHPTHPGHGPGPMEAAVRFLAERSDFRVDRSMHRFHLTQNPRGFLKRVR